MNKLCLVFPGQGSQKPRMGADLSDRDVPEYRATLAAADEVLGFKLSQMMLEASEDELRQTEIAQIAIFAMTCGILAGLDFDRSRLACVAGHSLGEYSALVAAGALDFKTGLKLVSHRSLFMSEAALSASGGMMAVLGLSREAVDAALRDAAAASAGSISLTPAVANHNNPEQIVISGPADSLLRAQELLSQAGAKRVVPLAVSGAFHSQLMKPAAERFALEVAKADVAAARIPVIANTSGYPITSPEDIKAELTAQITGPVEWVKSLETAAALGADTFVEIGPGKVLTGLVKKTLPGRNTYNIETAINLAGLAEAGLADSIRSSYVHA